MPARTLAPVVHLAAVAALAAPLAARSTDQPATPKNIIVFIADGAGINTHRTYEFYRGEPMAYLSDDWDRYSVATHALRKGIRPNGPDPLLQDPRMAYEPAKAWDATPLDAGAGGYPFYFNAYQWLRTTAPDSANTATAIFSGTLTYKGAIDVDGEGNPVRTAAEAANERGMAVGVVTSVPFDHATPACAAGAHVPKREMYHQIAHQMLDTGVCDVIAGTGNPLYDDNAQKRDTPDYTFISPEDWDALVAGKAYAAGSDTAWTLVQDTDQIRALAHGPSPERLVLIPRVGQTLQEKRSPWVKGDSTPPGGHPMNPGLPTLRDLTLAALNRLDNDPDGFFVMIEGGAVDWSMHDNQIGRMIEEMDDYHQTLEAVCALLDSDENGYDWSNTLVIVTSDHDHLLLGPDSDTVPFQLVTDNGPGELPGFRWHADNHSNTPVPLFVRGAGAERFAKIKTHTDEPTAPGVDIKRPPYFHHSEIGKVMLGIIDGKDRAGATAEGREEEALLR